MELRRVNEGKMREAYSRPFYSYFFSALEVFPFFLSRWKRLDRSNVLEGEEKDEINNRWEIK